jgi:hypothetical protein
LRAVLAALTEVAGAVAAGAASASAAASVRAARDVRVDADAGVTQFVGAGVSVVALQAYLAALSDGLGDALVGLAEVDGAVGAVFAFGIGVAAARRRRAVPADAVDARVARAGVAVVAIIGRGTLHGGRIYAHDCVGLRVYINGRILAGRRLLLRIG